MSRCQAPGHPDCWHECDNGTCVAFYEPETQLCISGCDEQLLSVGFVAAISRRGWNVNTTAEASGIGLLGLHSAARSVQAMASQRQIDTAALGRPSQNIDRLTRAIVSRIESFHGRSRLVFPKAPQLTLRWQLMPIDDSLSLIFDALPE
jgi:hypothetical protein